MMDLKDVPDGRTVEGGLAVPLRGRLLLDCSLLNKGSAFPEPGMRHSCSSPTAGATTRRKRTSRIILNLA